MKSGRIALVAALAALAAAPFAVQARAQAGAPAAITVTGEGQVAAAPDMATISVGVATGGETAAEALAANSAQMAQVLAALAAAGIDPRDVQTSSVSLNPVSSGRDSSQPPGILGYEVSNQVTVRVADLAALGKVMDALVAAGANQLYGLGFGLADPRPQTDAAREEAVADARRKAEILASAAGMRLGQVLAITEGGAAQGGPMPMYSRGAAAAVPVAAGEMSVSASVTLTWALVQP